MGQGNKIARWKVGSFKIKTFGITFTNNPSAIYVVVFGQHNTENNTGELNSEDRKVGDGQV